MPSVISESDLFAATLQRPNNGELADSASLLLFLQGIANRERWLYNRSHIGAYDASRVPYGADPTGAADSAPAFQAAHDAAFAASPIGGVVLVPPGTYKFNSGFSSWKNGISLVAVAPGTVTFQLNHATANWFPFGVGSFTGAPTVVSGIDFEGLIDCSGRVFYDAGGTARACHIIDCSYNAGSTHLLGQFFRCDGNASGSFVLDNVVGRIPTGGSDFVSFVNAGELTVRGGKISVPSVWAGGCISTVNGVKARLSGIHFDGSAYASGNGHLTVAGSGSKVQIDGCIYDAGSGSGIVPISISGGAILNTGEDNQFISCTPYDGGFAGLGSSLQLLPLLRIDLGGGSGTLLERGYRHYFVTNNVATALALPIGNFPGQRLGLAFFNADTSAHNLSFTTTALTATTVPNPVGPGNTMTGEFAWEDRDGSGTYRWIQLGTWGSGLTLV